MDNTLKIVNYLGKNLCKSFTMLGLSKAIKVPYATFHRTISKMKGLVNIQTVGKSKTISLNKSNPAIKSYLIISSEEEKKAFLKKQPLLSKLASELDTKDVVLLFGSYAKGSQKESSDIDLMIINKKGERSLSFSKYETLFRKKINPIFLTRNEFVKMLRDSEENVGKQALKAHIVLNNPEEFWGCVLNG
ncbi:MAG TPA: nucleotidyltransferase domain-containing protein [Candidatus Woesearchaeota archaeon]|nr:nucleotidyltransferase domain-containing protein [Candidatus Woesearchaeota archaeon]